MKKKMQLVIFISLIFLVTSCWSYQELNHLTIVTGIAVDKGEDDEFMLTFEVIDLSSSNKEDGIKTKTINSSGKTISESIKSAIAVSSHQLNFSNTELIIISNELGTHKGLFNILNFFIRDCGIRETIKVIISEEETASSLLVSDEITNNIISFNIVDIIETSGKMNLYTKIVQLYNVINILSAEGLELVLPVFKLSEFNQDEFVQLNGLAIFKDDKIIDYIPPEQTKYFLFIINKVKKGVIVFNKEDNKISAEIFKSSTKINYKMENDELKFLIDIKLVAEINEIKNQEFQINSKNIKDIEKMLSNHLNEEIENFIIHIQKNIQTDIFGFGNKIYRNNPKLWGSLKDNWDEIFQNLNFEVRVVTQVHDSSLIR